MNGLQHGPKMTGSSRPEGCQVGLLPAKINHTMPRICIHFELFKQLERQRERRGQATRWLDNFAKLTSDSPAASGHVAICQPASVHVSHLGQRQPLSQLHEPTYSALLPCHRAPINAWGLLTLRRWHKFKASHPARKMRPLTMAATVANCRGLTNDAPNWI